MLDVAMVSFTAHDRCDRCGAQAYTMAVRDDVAAELLFCAHHRREVYDRLEEDGWTIIDDYEAYRDLADGAEISYT